MKIRPTLLIFVLTQIPFTLPGEVLVGWHTPSNDDGTGTDSSPDYSVSGFGGVADGITRQISNGNGTGNNTPGGDGSTDNTFGTVAIPAGSLPSVIASWATETSNVLRSELRITLSNGTGAVVDLTGMHFDYDREPDGVNPPTNIDVTYVSGSLGIADGTALASYGPIASVVGSGGGDYVDADIDLTLLADHDLAAGETVEILIKASGGLGGAHDSLFIDNLAFTGTVATPPEPPASSIPAPAITWTSGSATPETALVGVTSTLSGTILTNGSNGSDDESYGSLIADPAAPATGGAFQLSNNQSLDIVLSNNAGRRVYLNRILLDFNPRTADAPVDVSVSYVSGDLDDATTGVGSLVGQSVLGSDLADYHDLDCVLADSLSDTYLDDGESATFRIIVSGASGSGSAFIDNIGFIAYRAPNLLVLLSDDQGYADVGFNTGNNEIPTPNIDRIADFGVNCTRAYVSYSVCGPSRAGLLTGRYQQRFGFERNPQYADPQGAVPHSEMMISESLEQVGYHSGAIGKWHVGSTEEGHPLNRGFDEFYGFLGGSHKYLLTNPNNGSYQYAMPDSYKAKNEPQSYQTWILDDHTPIDPSTYVGPGGQEWYLTDEFSAQAVDFITQNAASPWFLYVAYNAPHSPMEAPQRYLDRFPGLTDVSGYPRKTYAAMVSAMDDGIGLILDALNTLGLEDDTIVFFLSDNGGKIGTGANNDPLRGDKGDAYEGGMRVPFAVRWPGAIPQGITFDDPVMSLDIFGTIAAIAGAPTNPERPLDGVNIVPFLSGLEPGFPHDEVYLRKEKQQRYAVISADDDFKFVKQGTSNELFNIATDVHEDTDLAGSNPTRLAELLALRDTWVTGLIDPVFLGITDVSEEYFDQLPGGAVTEALLNQSMINVLTPNDDGSVTGLGNYVSPTMGTWTLNPAGSYNDPNDQGDHSLDITVAASPTTDELLAGLTLDVAVTLDATTLMQVYTQFLNINEAPNNGIRVEFQDSTGTVAASVTWGGTNVGTLLNGAAFDTPVPFTPRDNSDGVSGWDQYDANVRPLKVRLTREFVTVDFDGYTASGTIQNGVSEIKKIFVYGLAGGSLASSIYMDEIAVDLYVAGEFAPFTTAWDSGSLLPDVSISGINAQLTTTAGSSSIHGSTDGSYGTYNTVAPTTAGAFALFDGDFIDVSILNETGGPLMLENLWLDFNRDEVGSPANVTATYLSGDLDDAGPVEVGSLLNQPVVAADRTDFQDLDCVLASSLADTVLESGQSAVFRISVSNASGSGASYIDNIGFSTLMLGVIQQFSPDGSNLLLRWFAESGRSYTIETSPNLQPGSWTPLPGPIIGTGLEEEALLDPPSGPDTSVFYRLVIGQ
ncbi:sulfatase-like hydrolase/transferase [Oceanipulchritudo coccoides]|uniref:sulfatase-like hydrolase/transferase n=1 Tax=Oceanipulchritudo coccoides TaxID=2706888 RepID=UPI001EE9433C|nr:sulfatase-like hydrolase/transferase [Oceanipulchritudo coccoides]